VRVERIDEWLGSLSLPALLEDECRVLDSNDVLVTCAGFEERAFEYLRRAVKAGSKRFTLVSVEYRPSVPANRSEELAALAGQAQATLIVVEYDRQDPKDPSPSILKAVSERRLLVDVSGMSRLLVVQLVAAALRAGAAIRTDVVYSEALEYPPSKEEVDTSLAKGEDLFGVINFISSGVFGIIVPPELSATAMYAQPIRLIAFPTFNPAQFAALCAEINASAFSIIHGVPPDHSNAWRTEAIRSLNKLGGLREAEDFRTSTLDYRETIACLLSIYARDERRNKIVIAPTGSKMQSVAVGVVVGFLHDIQIVYPAPRSFPTPENYTKGVKQIYRLPLATFVHVPS
jgi:hypothetical protein